MERTEEKIVTEDYTLIWYDPTYWQNQPKPWAAIIDNNPRYDGVIGKAPDDVGGHFVVRVIWNRKASNEERQRLVDDLLALAEMRYPEAP